MLVAPQDILRELEHFKSVSQRLESIAEQHAHVTEALLTICGHRNNFGSASGNQTGRIPARLRVFQKEQYFRTGLFNFHDMSFETPDSGLERRLAERDMDRRTRQKTIHDAIRTFLGSAWVASQNGTCLNCGSATDLKAKATAFLPETGETWKISLPVCERCVEQSGSSVLVEHEA